MLECDRSASLFLSGKSMAKQKILKPDQSYTFSRYFELPYDIADILADLDCTFHRQPLQFPEATGTIATLSHLQRQLERNLLRVNPTSEAARREILIAPLLLEVCDLVDTSLNIEYSINVTDYLKGTLDYYINTPEQLLVVEAKQADLSRGFTQLAVELIALEQWTNCDAELLYGVVTTGEDWRFGVLQRRSRQIIQDIRLYQIPAATETLVRMLLGILQGLPMNLATG
ncbi:MAG: hypothetical protein VKJ24_08530 [Synechococcales bacterium]|nr:hypothetical protein [Synechococcales bacterium]